MENTVRIAYYDFWKGVAISMVVAIHTATFKTDVLFDSKSLCAYAQIIFRYLMNSAVPIFLSVSGYFLSKKKIIGLKECSNFWSKQIPKIYLPMLFWSIPIFVFQIINSDESFIKSCLLFFIGGYSIYYFIILIIQCYILLPLINKFKNMFLYVSIVCILLSWGILPPLPLILYAGFFVSWLYYFVLGIVLSETKNYYSISLVVIVIFVGIILQFLETKYLQTWGHISLGQKISSVVSNTGIILLMFSEKLKNAYKSNVICRFFELLGTKSFGIYLTHCYFITLLSFIYEIKNWSVKCSIVIILSLIFIIIVRNLLPYSVCNRYLGFR